MAGEQPEGGDTMTESASNRGEDGGLWEGQGGSLEEGG